MDTIFSDFANPLVHSAIISGLASIMAAVIAAIGGVIVALIRSPHQKSAFRKSSGRLTYWIAIKAMHDRLGRGKPYL